MLEVSFVVIKMVSGSKVHGFDLALMTSRNSVTLYESVGMNYR